MSAYYNFLLKIKPKPLMIALPKSETGTDMSRITDIPKISEPNVDEVELLPIKQNYVYVRIKYDNKSNEYLYEVIEPKLSEDERDVLTLLKETLVASVEKMTETVAEEKEKYLRRIVERLMVQLGVTLHPISKERVTYYIIRDFIGYGVINAMMSDPNVEDCSCDGVDVPFYIYHRKYGSIRSNLRFVKEVELDGYVVWLAQKCGKHISVASPLLDATIPDGSRLQATLGRHVTKRGSSFTIRRFKENPFTPLDLLKFKTMSTEMMAYLWISIEHGQSMLVCGGTASGKTTTLNAILLFIPPQMKIVSIEDTRELNLPHENWVPGLTREGFGGKSHITGRASGEIDMFDLLTSAMRQRPQYLMVGEVRGKEAYVVFQAMATGKTCYSTFHAEDVQAMVHRMENDPINLPRALITALNIVLLQAQVKVGTKMTRRVKSLTEIVGIDPETNELITNSVYTWNPADDSFNYSGHSYVYEKVRMARNWAPREMEREIKRRVDILEYMKKIGMDNHRKVATIISAYYKDPEKVMKEVRAKLAEGAEKL
ncbi:MAG: type II/IV secretion system ATPase subunit [Candidatus Thermoplasmatota archaeon]|nr:type II/IV secretion system ATPase subunit [Candidatus Thermoplasmatota archaeon]MBU1913880.1 type II/IV secretion system ATPase subunit [Candidatus Thermoplasmatota archaeon]